jgi:outer membrane protein assembly factor BamB
MASVNPEADVLQRRPPLRLWPGVMIVALQWLMRFVVPVVFPQTGPIGVLAGLACGLALIVWWLFFSRARWTERLAIFGVMVVAVLATRAVVHKSIATGMMGMMLYVYAIPTLSLALVAWAVATRKLADAPRRAWLLPSILLACGVWTLVRTGGFTSDLNQDFAWRWSATPEDRLLAQAGEKIAGSVQPAPTAGAPVAPDQGARIPAATDSSTLWPGFRGPNRDSIVRGVRIETNWVASPPVELWRRQVGPGWSSFAVQGNLLYTQEQRGDDEIVACYNVTNGEPVWRHQDATRFWESNAGPGPRATPTLHQRRAYTFGATGILNVLDAQSGRVVWTRNAAAETKTKIPDWGFASSPLVVGDVVIVAVGGTLAAYDLADGAPRWFGPKDGGSYSSPHLLEIDGVRQILLMSGAGATSVAPTDGKLLWQHAWKGFGIVQPAQIAAGDVLISTGDRTGVRRIEIVHAGDSWTIQERWTSTRLKPYFNDFVLHGGHAFGFDSGTLACVNVEDGGRKWKGGRYGSGQLILLAEQELLLVLSEQGELALVPATPKEFTELARFRAVEGKTWNHPVLAGDVLLVRNDREMVAFRLALKR